MKICWFNHRCISHPEAGGSEVHLHQIASRLIFFGHDVTVFCESVSGLSSTETIDGVKYHRRGNRFTLHLWALWVLLTQRFDLVIDDIAHAAPWGSPLLHKNVVAIVHHVHGKVLLKETGSLLGRILMLAEALIPSIYSNTPFITVSESSKASLINLGIKDENISIIHNGVELVESKEKKNQTPQLIYFGRYKKYKNIELLLEIFNKLNEEQPDSKLILAGKNTDHPHLATQINSLGLHNSVTQYGQVSEQEKADLLASSWVHLTTSSVEGWSITTIEAAIHGTPTVAFNVKGLRDSILHNKTGVLVPAFDQNLFLSEIRFLIHDRERLSRMSADTRDNAFNFTWENSADRFNSAIMEGNL